MDEYVSFPGLGISPIKIDPVAFSIFGYDIVWYGVLIAVGMIVAYINGSFRAKHEGIKSDDLIDLALFVILFGVIGARLYYILFNLDMYIVTGKGFWGSLGATLLKMINIREGGLAIYGGVIAGVIAGYFVAKFKRIRFPVILDILASSVIIAQSIGRWGNFMNMEAYGAETILPWRMGLLSMIPGSDTIITETYVHPTFLYESLWNLIGFILIAIFYNKKKYHGQVCLWYVTWYGFGRMFIEGLRQDSLYIGSLRVSQALAAIAFIAGAVMLVIFHRRYVTPSASNKKYTPVFEDATAVSDSHGVSTDNAAPTDDSGALDHDAVGDSESDG